MASMKEFSLYKTTGELIYSCNAKNLKNCIKEAIKQGKNLEGIKLTNQKLKHMDFSGLKLDGADFSGSDLRGSNFDLSSLKNSTLKETNLNKASMQSVKLQNSNLEKSKFQGTDLMHANLEGSKMAGASFKYAHLRFANYIKDVDFGKDENKADFSRVIIDKGYEKLLEERGAFIKKPHFVQGDGYRPVGDGTELKNPPKGLSSAVISKKSKER